MLQYLNVSQIAANFGVSKATVWRWTKDGTLPAPVKLGFNTTRWRAADLEARPAAAAKTAAE